ncbi:tail fiber assembly protein [Cupriavidus sp. 2MCAB6]|uniref:tail fiber assembly protein n=1 Tax=Cupriavidus sp. 2MCAB6 TaxID=3232981 RepID=UPI003F8DF05D
MLIHCYDNQTGQYISSRLADPDPLHEGRWLEPAFTTPMPLPDRAPSTWPFFVDGSWVMAPDFRGKMLYRQDTGDAAEILVPGVTPDEAGLTTLPRPSSEHRWSDGQWAPDPEAVAQREREAAMTEFEALLAGAREVNAGKADAYAAGLLTAFEVAMFKAWANYQMDLVRVLSMPGFPAERAWPAEPDPVEIAAAVEQAAMAAAEKEAAASVAADPTAT